MKKVLPICVILVLALTCIQVYAVQDKIIEIKKGENIELEFNLNDIELEQFYIVIKDNPAIYGFEETNENYVFIDKNNIETEIIKEVILLNSELENEFIELETAIVEDLESLEEGIEQIVFTKTIYKVLEEKTDNNEENTDNDKEHIDTEEENKPDNNQDKPSNEQIREENNIEQSQKEQQTNIVQNITQQIVQTTSKSAVSQSTTPTVTYEGSQNNYLSSLSITGYELNTEFNKTNNTYFATVDSDSIEIQTEKEDSNQIVKIYGNENLKEGKNKVIISVTAENGDVRIYRIFVTK